MGRLEEVQATANELTEFLAAIRGRMVSAWNAGHYDAYLLFRRIYLQMENELEGHRTVIGYLYSRATGIHPITRRTPLTVPAYIAVTREDDVTS